jgi:PAS domain S-box-containing protein
MLNIFESPTTALPENPQVGSMHHGRLRQLLVLGLVCANILVFAFAGYSLYRSRQQYELRAQTLSKNIARAVDQDVSGSIGKIDLALHTIADELEHQLAGKGIDEQEIKAYMLRHEQRLPQIEGLRVSNTAGWVFLGKGLEKAERINILDRDYFIYNRDHAGDNLFITKPLLGRILHRYAIIFAKRYNYPDGRFAGVVHAVVDLDHFSKMLSRFVINPGDALVLRDADLGLIARFPAIPEKPGGVVGDKVVSSELRQLAESGVRLATYHVKVKSDDVERTITFHRLNDAPMFVLAGVASDDYLADWLTEAYQTTAIAFGFLFGSLLLGWLSLRLLREAGKRESILTQSEQRLLMAQESGHVGIWEFDIATGKTYWSPECERIFGLVAGGLKSNEDWRSRVHPDDIPLIVRQWESRILHGEPFEVEFRFHLDSGETRWLVSKGRAQYDADGKPIRLSGINIDITDRKNVELKLEEYRQSLEDLVEKRTSSLKEANSKLLDTQFAMESVGIGIHWVDAETGRFVYVNKYVAEVLGYTVDEMLRLSVWDIDRSFQKDTFKNLVEMLRQQGHTQFETTARAKTGGSLPVEVTLYYLPGDEMGPARVISFLTDITKRKEAEQALIHAKEVADGASRSKSAFLANMSHEIRTPMNGILGMANIMRREGVTPKQAERLDTIGRSAQHLLSVINDILDISKIEAGKFVLEEIPVAIERILTNVSSILSDHVKAKSINLLMENEPLPHNLVGDPTRLQQALLNYATNAVKFTETGAVTLRARKQEETADWVLLRFEVQDTGIGITPEAMSRLFSAFEQADNSMTRKYGGTGLGLAITRRLAELMGGEVGADSTPGVGSTFWFTVRLKKGAAVAATQAETATDAGALIRQNYSGARILVVDDEPINREVAQIQLEAIDLVVDTAEDGAEAVAKAQATSYAAIFMDMQMPKLNGMEATQQIRELPGYRQTPIIAMTANAFAEDRARCLKAGMNDFLIKPFDSASMFAILLSSLSRHDIS